MNMKTIKGLINYGIGGVCTTLINYTVYFCLSRLSVHYIAADIAAWAAAVVFSYWIHRKVLFHSDQSLWREFFSFCSLRLMTLLAELLLLTLTVSVLHIPDLAAKIIVSIVTVLSNYFICSKKLFKKGAAV